MPKKRLAYSVSDEMHEVLKELAQREGRSVSNFVTKSLKEFIEYKYNIKIQD